MNKIRLGILVLAAAGLAGCATARLPADDRGVSFPPPEASYRSQGLIAAPETLQLLLPGLRKDQVRELLGAPHFSEGLFGVRDWNYRVDFRRAEGTLQCQLQLQFAGDTMTALYWRTGDCAAAAGPVAAATAATATAEASAAPAEAGNWSLDRLLFPFGRSAIEDLPAQDRARLDAFADRIVAQAGTLQRVTVAGHADRIGSAERKYRRSLARAQAVADRLIQRGVDPRRIQIVGRGDAEADTECAQALPETTLKECLLTDRGVIVEVILERP